MRIDLGLFSKNKTSRPLHSELEQMLAVLDSLKEESKLWSSKYKKNGVDLFISSTILWFVYDIYGKVGLKKEGEASLETLKNLLILYLEEQEISDLNPSDLLEILQCVVLLLEKYKKKRIFELLNKLTREFEENERSFERILHIYNPFESHLPSLIILTIIHLLQLFPKLNIQSNLPRIKKILDYYIEKISENKGEYVEPSALYWITEVFLKYSRIKSEKYFDANTMMSVIKHIELSIIKSIDLNNLDNIPLDRLLWYYHSLENYIKLMDELKEPISQYIKKLHDSIMKSILKKGFIIWISSSYGSVFRNMRLKSTRFAVSYQPSSIIDIDLITLSLLIGAYDRMEKHVITYVTEYDLKRLNKVEKISFIIGFVSVISGSMILSEAIISGKLFNLANFKAYLPTLFLGILLIGTGVYIEYSLLEGKNQDLKRSLSDYYKHLQENSPIRLNTNQY